MITNLIIWDFDGVIADSEKIWIRNRQEELNKRYHLNWDFNTTNKYLGGMSDKTKREVLNSLGIITDDDFWKESLRKDILCLKTPFLQTLSAANVTAVWIASIFCIFGASAKKHFRRILSKTTVFAYTTLRNAANPLHPATLRRRDLSPSSIRVSDVGISPLMKAITFTISNA